MRKSLGLILTTTLVLGASFPAFSKVKKNETFPNVKLSRLNKTGRNPAAAGGSEMSIAQFKGKVVIVDFWASWCEPCKVALPAYNKIFEKYKSKGLVVVGVNVDDERSSGLNFLKEHPVKFPVLFDEGRKLIENVEVATMPTSFIIGKNGKVLEIHKGFREGDEAEVEKLIKKLL